MEKVALLWSRFEQFLNSPAISRFLARWAVLVGTIAVIIVAIIGVGYFAMDLPMRDVETGKPVTPAKAVAVTLILGAAGAISALVGAHHLRRLR